MSDGAHPTYRSPSLLATGVTGLALVGVLGLWVVVDELRHDRVHEALVVLLWAALVAELLVEACLRPAVSATDAGVVLVNPFQTVRVAWADVRGLETRLALQVLVDGGKHTSWAATGSRRADRRAQGTPRRGLRGPLRRDSWLTEVADTGTPPPPKTPPEACRVFIEAGRVAWEERTRGSDGAAPPVAGSSRRVGWHRVPILAVAGTAVLAVTVTWLL